MEESSTRNFYASAPSQYWVAPNYNHPLLRDMVKRLGDIVVSLLGLVLLSPLFLLIAILIKRDSPGPVFFRGQRMGRKGNLFRIIKFRTMYEQPESYQGPGITSKDDPRVTRLGRWLRRTKLNELPQLWNVLIGEMSLVGPRPEDPLISTTWPKDVFQEVLSVRPGITSPASVSYRNEESLLNSKEVIPLYLESVLPSKLRLDQLYVRHRTLLLDLDILFWTFLVLLPKLGTLSPAEERLFFGPLSVLIKRHVSWFTIDALLTFICIGVVGAFWRSFEPLNVGRAKSLVVAIGFALLFSLFNAIMGVNRISWKQARFLDIFNLIPALGIATIAALLANQFLGGRPLLPVGLVLISASMAFLGFVFVRYRSRLLSGVLSHWLVMRGKAWPAHERALIIGGGDTGQFIAWLLQNGRSSQLFRVIGIVDDDLYKQGTRIGGVNVLGTRNDIPHLIAKHDIGIIFFAIHNISPIERAYIQNICASTPARLVIIPDVLAALQHSIPIAHSYDKTTAFKWDSVDSLGNLDGIPPEQVVTWLGELDQKAKAGDFSAVHEYIHALRAQILGEVSLHKASSLPGR